MKAFLMYRDQDLDLEGDLPPNTESIVQDMGLNILFEAMSKGDRSIHEIVRKVLLLGLGDLETLAYRQSVLEDCLGNSSVVRDIYQLSIELKESKSKRWFGVFSKRRPGSVLYESREMMHILVALLKRLRNIADEHANKFHSEGFTSFFEMIKREFHDEYFGIIHDHLKELEFARGVLVSAELGKGNEGKNYVLRKPPGKKTSWMEWIFANRSPSYSFTIAPRDESGARALEELRERGINLVASALGQAVDHIDSFFEMLRIELAFYIGCLNLREQLEELEIPTCFPSLVDANERRHSFEGLCDVCLALSMKQHVVGNTMCADNKDIVVITGANQGGKSTFLRSIGLSQLMMQCGMFVPAESFSANMSRGVFTHYKREEDATMKKGKLDEELSRMNDIATWITSNSLVLFNESFAATNEREGSEIAKHIILAMLEKRIKIFFVTHLYEFANGLSYNATCDFLIATPSDACHTAQHSRKEGGRTWSRVHDVTSTSTPSRNSMWAETMLIIL